MATSDSSVATPEAPAAGDDGLPKPLNLDVAVDTVSTCQRRVKVTIPRADIDRYREIVARNGLRR